MNLQVRLDGLTVWLTQAQLAELYQTTPQNITLQSKAFATMENCWNRQLVRTTYKFAKRAIAKSSECSNITASR